MTLSFQRWCLPGSLLLLLGLVNSYQSVVLTQRSRRPPSHNVDPFWPKPLPSVKDADGQTHHWITGEVGATCIDANDHTGSLVGGLGRPGHMAGELAFPHTLAVDSKGNVYVSETISGRRSQKFTKVG
jgi:hypothetical protein